MADTDPVMETWDEYWSERSPRYAPHDILIDHVLRHVISKNSIIAETGAGLAVDAVEIARSGYSVLILDISRESLKQAASKAQEAGVELMAVMGDVLNLPFKPRSVDFIYNQGLLEHFKDPGPLLNETKAAIKPGGKILVDVPQTFTIYTLKKKWAMARGRWFAGWETQYTLGKLRRILKKSGFTEIDNYGRNYDLALLVWLSDIDTLGKTRFGRPVIPRIIRKPVGAAWRFFERMKISNYLKHSVGIVAVPDESGD